MAQSRFGGDIQNLSKGWVTEATPLNFPEGASLDELNIELKRTGDRARRFGFDFESGYLEIKTDVPYSKNIAFSSYLWKAPNGMTDEYISVIQCGGSIYFFDGADGVTSSTLLFEERIAVSDTTQFTMASVDGKLVITTGEASIVVISGKDDDIKEFVVESNRLKIRDLFGVEDVTEDGVDLREGDGVAIRPKVLTQEHCYNLRNQTFAYSRVKGEGSRDEADPINYFFDKASKYPANSDNVVPYLYADANNTGDRNVKRYFAYDAVKNPLGTTAAPKGGIIIDALKRGASRIEACQKLYGDYPLLGTMITTLPTDYSPDGATCLTAFAGRIFYGGFTNKVIEGDSYSPRLGSYILFSKIVKSPQDIFTCYQEGDPTSTESPDLLDTDGGFIKVDGAAQIYKLVPNKAALFIFASNGVWMIDGGNNYGFTATNYKVTKLSDVGCVSSDSITFTDAGMLFWGEGGIYNVNQNQYGDWQVDSVTDSTIATWYKSLPDSDKEHVKGFYEPYSKQVRWLLNSDLASTVNNHELIFDLGLGAFTKFEIFAQERLLTSSPLRITSYMEVAPFVSESVMYYVIDLEGNNVVDSEGNDVVVYQTERIDSAGNADVTTRKYVVATTVDEEDNVVKFTFGGYTNASFRDFYSYDSKGVDAAGYLLTGYVYNQDLQRKKQLPYVTVYSRRTETGFTDNWTPKNIGSIHMCVQWEWTDTAKSNKWSKPVQVYRQRRSFYPDDKDAFDDGYPVVVTKNKVRGIGRTISIKFSTEEGKDLKLLGYSLWGSMNASI